MPIIKKRKHVLITVFLCFVLIGMAILFALSLKSQEKDTNQTWADDASLDLKDKKPEFPEDFPIYQNADLITSSVSENGKGISNMWETQDDASFVYEYLKSELRIKGWTLSNDSSAGDSMAVSFEKENTSGFLGVFKDSGGKSIISITMRLP